MLYLRPLSTRPRPFSRLHRLNSNFLTSTSTQDSTIMGRFILCLAAFGSIVNAFPHLMQRDPSIPRTSPEMQIQARQLSVSEGNCGPTACTVFDETDQFVNVTPGSPHQYVPPGSGDIRGPCPGLNAAANHGFLPHNGVPSITQSNYLYLRL